MRNKKSSRLQHSCTLKQDDKIDMQNTNASDPSYHCSQITVNSTGSVSEHASKTPDPQSDHKELRRTVEGTEVWCTSP